MDHAQQDMHPKRLVRRHQLHRAQQWESISGEGSVEGEDWWTKKRTKSEIIGCAINKEQVNLLDVVGPDPTTDASVDIVQVSPAANE